MSDLSTHQTDTRANANEVFTHERLAVLETRFDTVFPTLATKSDISELRGEMGELRGEMGELRGEIRAEIGEMRSEMGGLRAEIHRVDASIKTWMVGTVVTIIGTMLAAILGVSQIFKGASAPPATSAAPIIIQIPSLPSEASAKR